MLEIGLIGGSFQHAYSSTWWKKPKSFSWAKNEIRDITCFMEEQIIPNIGKHANIRKFAWIVESTSILNNYHNNLKQLIIDNYKSISEHYEFLISHDRDIVSLADNFYYLPPNGFWIESPQIYPKTKLCSMISSNKRMCDGHNFRLDWVDRLKNKLDLFGIGINPFQRKEEALADYMFSVTIENSQYKTYWTEKILDCFACGTIPIYHGAPDIADYFNMDGIILLNDTFDPVQLTKELYFSKMEAILDNFQRTLEFEIIEDIMYNKFICTL